MTYIYASDPHGIGAPWIELIKKAKNKYKHSKIIFGGDYIDGNKYSKETLDYIMTSVKNDNSIALLGNHEQMMIDFINNTTYDSSELWIWNGGKTTIKSLLKRGYSRNITRIKLKQTPYYNFIKTLKPMYMTKNMIFVHAGFDTKKEIQDKNYLLWARDEYFYENPNSHDKYKTFAHNNSNKVIISGHTPTCLITGKINNRIIKPPKTCPVLKIQHPNEKPRYFTDNGCHGIKEHTGNVCVFDDDGTLLEVIKN